MKHGIQYAVNITLYFIQWKKHLKELQANNKQIDHIAFWGLQGQPTFLYSKHCILENPGVHLFLMIKLLVLRSINNCPVQ